ncbi:hypothetical protein BLNAU_24628 [Blattamonas nauphoetae]|uniref:Uncharacterized protein n=1 Tax=Blattamonas nauphoetae TaxID=2049346 RepID=A0ABQ9WLW0_9EUKA|nr:hypothetical protein BLNAU_24628 [Blattamonas nauphoetae]
MTVTDRRTAAPPVSSRPCKHGIRELVGMTCVRSVAARLKLELSSPTTVDTLASRSPAASEAEALPDCPSSTGLQPTPATLFVVSHGSSSHLLHNLEEDCSIHLFQLVLFCTYETGSKSRASIIDIMRRLILQPASKLSKQWSNDDRSFFCRIAGVLFKTTITGRSLSLESSKPHQTALPRPGLKAGEMIELRDQTIDQFLF